MQSFHCSVENLMIWPKGTAPDHIISIDNSYSVRFSNVRIHEAQSGLASATIVLMGDVSVGGHGPCNNILWENVIVRNDSTFPKIAVLAHPGSGTHTFIAPDIERAETLLEWRGGQLEIISPYTERAGKYALNCNVAATDTTASLITHGGVFSGADSTVSCAIRSTTRNFVSFGTQWTNPAHAVYVYGIPATPINFHGIVPNLNVTGASRFSGVSGWQIALGFPDFTISNSKPWIITVPGRDQVTTTITVAGVQVGTHWARANMNVDLAGIQLSAYVSAADTVTVVAQYNKSNPVPLNGTLRVTCGWG